MAVDSGTYTDDTLWRRRQLAQQLAELNKQPIIHRMQGVSQLVNNFMGGYEDAKIAHEGKVGDFNQRKTEAGAYGVDTSGWTEPKAESGFTKIAKLITGGGEKPAAVPSAAPVRASDAPRAAAPPAPG